MGKVRTRVGATHEDLPSASTQAAAARNSPFVWCPLPANARPLSRRQASTCTCTNRVHPDPTREKRHQGRVIASPPVRPEAHHLNRTSEAPKNSIYQMQRSARVLLGRRAVDWCVLGARLCSTPHELLCADDSASSGWPWAARPTATPPSRRSPVSAFWPVTSW
jgi:hypothetical protein